MASLFSIAILSINNKNQILYLPNYRAQTYYTETDWPYGHLGNKCPVCRSDKQNTNEQWADLICDG